MAQLVDDQTLDGVWDAAERWLATSVGPRLAILATTSMHLRDEASWDSEWEPSLLVEGPTYGVRVARTDPVFQPRRAATTLSTVTRRMVPRVAPINLSPQPLELQTFIDRVIVPALLDRFLRERVDDAPARRSATVHLI